MGPWMSFSTFLTTRQFEKGTRNVCSRVKSTRVYVWRGSCKLVKMQWHLHHDKVCHCVHFHILLHYSLQAHHRHLRHSLDYTAYTLVHFLKVRLVIRWDWACLHLIQCARNNRTEKSISKLHSTCTHFKSFLSIPLGFFVVKDEFDITVISVILRYNHFQTTLFWSVRTTYSYCCLIYTSDAADE